MKSVVFRIMVLLVIALVLATCSLFENTFEFINNSSYTVEVTPLGQDSWEFFQLEPDETNKIRIKDDYISFLYWPANTVDCDKSQNGKIIFTNN